MIEASGRPPNPFMNHPLRSIATLTLGAAAIEFIPWHSDSWLAFPVVAGIAAAGAWVVDRRHPWPWALIIAASIIAVVTDQFATGVTAGEADEDTAAFTMLLMIFLVVVLAGIGTIRSLVSPEPPPNPADRTVHRYTVPAQALTLTLSVIPPISTYLGALGIPTAAFAIATASHTGRARIPWVICLAAATASLAAYYPATDDYYDPDTLGATLAGTNIPDLVLIAAAVLTLVTIAAWGTLTLKGREKDEPRQDSAK